MMAQMSDPDSMTPDTAASRTPRRKVYYSAMLHIRELTIRCRIRDLSETGALVETTIPLWSGAPCHIALPKIGHAHGTLVWADGPRSGMQFNPPLQASQLAALNTPLHSERIATHSPEAARPKAKKIAAEVSQDRARNAVSWLRSK
jgi:hypothetical protein